MPLQPRKFQHVAGLMAASPPSGKSVSTPATLRRGLETQATRWDAIAGRDLADGWS